MNAEKVKLAIAPIAWTNDDMPDLGSDNTFEQCVSEMALAGFTGCEIGCKYPADAAELKHKLDVRSLTICNAWFSSFLTSQPEEYTLNAFAQKCDFLKSLGAKVIGVSEQGNSIQGKLDAPIFDEKPVYTDEQWDAVIGGFNKMGAIAKEKGMTMTVHHHMGTGIQTADEIDIMMSRVDPDLVYLLYDTGHLAFSGEDHIALLEKYAGRIKHVHLKDIRKGVHANVKPNKMSFLDAVRAGVFTVPGDGDIDFAPVFDILEKSGYSGWMVVEAEQDPAKANPFEYAVKARKYIREKAGV